MIVMIMPVLPVNAAVVSGLYEITVPVVTQSREERELVVRDALKAMLMRISGRNDAALLAEDETLVPRPTRLVQQFRYRKFAADEVIPPVAEGEKPYRQKLWLRFTASAIGDLLRQHGFPVWGKNRPAILLWLVVDDQRHRVLMGNNMDHAARTLVAEEAKKHGLPVRLPLLDLADQSRIQVTDVWGNFEDTILSASARYHTEAVLVGRIYLGYGKTWFGRWSLYNTGQRDDWQVNGTESLRAAIREGLNKTTELLSQRFAQVDTLLDKEQVIVKVRNIADLKSYNLAMRYLQGLNVVSAVEVLQVKPQDVTFALTTRSGRLGIAQAISLGHLLEAEFQSAVVTREPENSPVKKLQPDLLFRLVP